jgi:tryptophan synthase beta subunit
MAPVIPADQSILVCLSGRGDKDVEQVARLLDDTQSHTKGAGA